MACQTRLATLDKYRKGSLELFGDDPRRYAFSNVYEIGNGARPFERIAVTKSMEYVTEVMRVEGGGPWFAAGHDEFALVMDGEVDFTFIKLSPFDTPEEDSPGAKRLPAEPCGARMGAIRGRRGHLVLLPRTAGYHLSATRPSLVILQTTAGELTHERWSEICAGR